MTPETKTPFKWRKFKNELNNKVKINLLSLAKEFWPMGDKNGNLKKGKLIQFWIESIFDFVDTNLSNRGPHAKNQSKDRSLTKASSPAWIDFWEAVEVIFTFLSKVFKMENHKMNREN